MGWSLIQIPDLVVEKVSSNRVTWITRENVSRILEKIHTYEHVVSDYSNNGGLGGVPRIWSDMVLDLGRGGLVYNHVLGLLHDHGYSSIVLYPRNSPIQKQGEGR